MLPPIFALGNPGPAGRAWYINQTVLGDAMGPIPRITVGTHGVDFRKEPVNLATRIPPPSLQYVIKPCAPRMPNWKSAAWRKA